MLNHKGTIIIETERLLLRRFTRKDAADVFNNWAGDIEICRYMRWAPHRNIEETRKVIQSWIDSYYKNNFYQWAITLKGKTEPIGAIGLFIVNENDLCGDVGYCISKEYWGQGITTDALKAVISFAFDRMNFNRIETYHSIHNPASGRVMQKAGMVFEGMAKQKYRSISGFEDSNMYAMIREDYLAIK
ncbi:MAG: GNAT family N-acetyltransferase [Mobilitalea sp.]